eukprot:UN19624
MRDWPVRMSAMKLRLQPGLVRPPALFSGPHFIIFSIFSATYSIDEHLIFLPEAPGGISDYAPAILFRCIFVDRTPW